MQKMCQSFKEGHERATMKMKSKIEHMVLRREGYDMLSKEASSIKTNEIEKKLPIVKKFEKLVLLIEQNKIKEFEQELQIEEDKEREEYKKKRKNKN